VVGSNYLLQLFARISASLSAPIFPMSHQDSSSHMQIKIMTAAVDGLLIRGIYACETGLECWY
jgi:hypothetical protein